MLNKLIKYYRILKKLLAIKADILYLIIIEY